MSVPPLISVTDVHSCEAAGVHVLSQATDCDMIALQGSVSRLIEGVPDRSTRRIISPGKKIFIAGSIKAYRQDSGLAFCAAGALREYAVQDSYA